MYSHHNSNYMVRIVHQIKSMTQCSSSQNIHVPCVHVHVHVYYNTTAAYTNYSSQIQQQTTVYIHCIPTWTCLPDKDEVIQSKCKGEEHKHPVVVVAHAAGEPHAVVVKTITAAIAQLAVLSVVRNHNLKLNKESFKWSCNSDHYCMNLYKCTVCYMYTDRAVLISSWVLRAHIREGESLSGYFRTFTQIYDIHIQKWSWMTKPECTFFLSEAGPNPGSQKAQWMRSTWDWVLPWLAIDRST